MGRKVLVTGGAGFIGSHLAEELIRCGHEVAVLDNLSGGSAAQVPAGVRLYELDITESIDEAFEDFRPDDVVHLAAQVSVAVSMQEPEMDARINVLGSINVITAAQRHDVRRVVYASSAACYGALEEGVLREEMRCVPASYYGASKYAVEHYLHSARQASGLEWAALRFANVYGPRQDPHGEAGVVAIFARLLLDGGQPEIFGGGELKRDYVFVTDIARAVGLGKYSKPALGFTYSLSIGTSPEMVRSASTSWSTVSIRVLRASTIPAASSLSFGKASSNL